MTENFYDQQRRRIDRIEAMTIDDPHWGEKMKFELERAMDETAASMRHMRQIVADGVHPAFAECWQLARQKLRAMAEEFLTDE